MIKYSTDTKITADQFISVLERSTLAERRPVDDPEIIALMIENSDLLMTAWQGELLVGVARSVTDFAYCCYLSDLAVDAGFQRQGIGKKLIDLTQQYLGPRCKVILLAAPAAVDYYPKLGFDRFPSAWILPRTKSVR